MRILSYHVACVILFLTCCPAFQRVVNKRIWLSVIQSFRIFIAFCLSIIWIAVVPPCKHIYELRSIWCVPWNRPRWLLTKYRHEITHFLINLPRYHVRKSITNDTMLQRVSAWQIYRGWYMRHLLYIFSLSCGSIINADWHSLPVGPLGRTFGFIIIWSTTLISD